MKISFNEICIYISYSREKSYVKPLAVHGTAK